MELMLDNVGIIRNSLIQIDGLTVITGKNSSGKTTIGKVLYAVIQANSNIDVAFEQSKETYVLAQFKRIWRTLGARRSTSIRASQLDELSDNDRVLLLLSIRNPNLNSELLVPSMYYVKDVLEHLSYKEFVSFLDKVNIDSDQDRAYYKVLSEQFENRKERSIEIITQAITTIEAPEAYYVFQNDRIKAYLNSIFHDQIKPIKAQKSVAVIRMTESGRPILNARIRSKHNFRFLKESSFVFPYNQAIFIDDPFVIDRLMPAEDELTFFDSSLRALQRNELFIESDVQSYRNHLIDLLTSKATVNFFDDLDFQKRYHPIIEKINQIVPGEFQETENGMFYVDNGSRLNVQNLATGSKLFFIIKLLFMNGYLNKDTVLVLDEPESHLHPEWINKFAEIMVLFIKELGLHVLLTTHSPNLLLALNVYSKNYSISKEAHFYLAQNSESSWDANIKCIDDNINEGYAHLSIPLIQMSVQNEEIG